MLTVIILVCSLKSICIPSLVLIPVSEMANILPEGVCFTTTLFITMFTVIVLVYSLKSMILCIPSFVLIGGCVTYSCTSLS